jgi:hypothetical protein
MDSSYSILVNSTDNFEDCWFPFFKLFSKFWSPPYTGLIFLNTETKEFAYPGLNIVCTKVSDKNSHFDLAWSKCLLRCLDQIPGEIILYFQEDYFLNAPIQVEKINEFVGIMVREGYSHISLVPFSNGGPFHPSPNPELWVVDQKADYRLSLQAGLWRKSRLRSYIRRHETPWQFEVWGSQRAHRIKDTILCVNHDMFAVPNQIISYEPTGIIKGKWNKKAVYDLFTEIGIKVKFTQRGFYDADHEMVKKAPLLVRAVSRIRSYF